MNRLLLILSLLVALAVSSCRGDIYVEPSDSQEVDDGRFTSVRGFYLLNEGNMGSNRASLDFYDETSGVYTRNIYAERNPSVVKELGDVGNSLLLYGSRLYAVINCSHKVEVMRAGDAVRVGQVDIPNCRYMAAHGGYLYVSSYVSPVISDPSAPLGAVFKIDTLTLNIVGRVEVGFQPEELAVVDGKLYVANSGGYRKPLYDHTVSVVDLNSFTVVKEIDVDINLHRLRPDGQGRLLVSSRGDNKSIPSSLYVIDCAADCVVAHIDVPVNNLAVHGDRAYVISSSVNEITGTPSPTYNIIDLNTLKVASESMINDGTESSIKMPYGIALHPVTGEIYITDARNYVSSGVVRCYSPSGILRWSHPTGDIPSDIVFLPR